MEADYRSWPLDRLATYIEQNFHCYIRSSVPAIRSQLQMLCSSDSVEYPALAEIERIFITATNELERHLCREEEELFPVIEAIMAGDNSADVTSEHVHESLQHLLREHDAETAFFNRIERLTSGYTAPEEACEELRHTFGQLQEFDRKLRRHIHLENDALFPTAAEMVGRQ